MRAHTKGEWYSTAGFVAVGEAAVCSMARTDSPIKYAAEAGSLEDSANARLIAASPDMMEALDECDTAFAVLNINSDEPMNPQARQAMRSAWEKTQAALAKALGRVDMFKEEEEA